jgi:membrane protease YdiL (CAAX protease family)
LTEPDAGDPSGAGAPTARSDPAGADAPTPGARSADPAAPAAGPPGTGTFTIEGRRAPALFVVGWLATIAGAGLFAVGVLAGSGTATVWLAGIGAALLAVGLVAGAGSQAIERAARGPTADDVVSGYLGPSPVLVFGAVVALTLLLGLLVSVPLELADLDTDAPAATFIGLLLTAAIYIGLIRLLVVGTGALSWAEMGVRRPTIVDLSQLLYGAMLGVPLVFVSGILALALSQVLAPSPSPLPESGDALGALLNLLSAAVIAPIAEELFFRGFATTAWLRSLGERTAIVRGALFFALAHVIPLIVGAPDLGQVAFAFLVRLPVALALGWVFVRRGSLYAAIGLHAAFNGLPVLVVLLGGGAGA